MIDGCTSGNDISTFGVIAGVVLSGIMIKRDTWMGQRALTSAGVFAIGHGLAFAILTLPGRLYDRSLCLMTRQLALLVK